MSPFAMFFIACCVVGFTFSLIAGNYLAACWAFNAFGAYVFGLLHGRELHGRALLNLLDGRESRK